MLIFIYVVLLTYMISLVTFPRVSPRSLRRFVAANAEIPFRRQVCVCYTSDLQTSSIFTVDYYKGVAKRAAEAGAHMIGIKVRLLYFVGYDNVKTIAVFFLWTFSCLVRLFACPINRPGR